MGQNYGKEAFWVQISRFNATTSWRHTLKLEQLLGPTSTPGAWHTTSISVAVTAAIVLLLLAYEV